MRHALIISFSALLFALPAAAQTTPQRFSTPAFAVDGATLHGSGRNIALWGLDPVFQTGTSENLSARTTLDDIISNAPVHCIPKGNQPFAQCLNTQERDIALLMITNGYGVANRRQLEGSELFAPYIQAEQHARAQQLGIWGKDTQTNTEQAPSSSLPIHILLLLIAVPLIGFVMLALILQRGFKELITLQKYQIAGTQKRERELKAREKHVIAAALESEINTNRAKLDAYLIIYEELLKSLRDPTKTPKYQRAGDIIHDKPALTRTVYDSNLDKLDLLGSDITNKLSALYQSIDPNPDYRTLEPEMPLEKVWEMVERIIRNAERMTEPMDQVVGALNVILRDRRIGA